VESNERLDKMMEDIAQTMTSDRLKAFLKTRAVFTGKSLFNWMLIMWQNMGATNVQGMHTWNKLGRRIKKGEKALWYYAPRFVKETDDKGKETQSLKGFFAVYGFDVSQTEGKELPEIALDYPGESELYEKTKEIFNEYDVEEILLTDGSKGYATRSDNRIVIHKEMETKEKANVLFHEMAHKILHGKGEDKRSDREVEAESVAYMVACHFGIENKESQLEYVAAWGEKKKMNEIRELISRIEDTAMYIIKRLEPKEVKQAA
jgi:hypothetical protein